MMDNMKGVMFIVIILAVDLYLVSAKTSSLVLHLAPTVTAGQSAQYNCSSEGTGPDPTIVWSVKDSNGVEKLSNAQLNSIVVEGAADSTDGRVKSSVTFLVTSEYLSSLHRLWCGAIDSGSSVTSIQIYATIQATTTTTANLGEFCSNSVTCAIASSYCDTSSSRCKCSPGYYDNNGENVAGGSCSLQGGLGATCQAGNDLSCGALYSRCSQSSPYVCVCQSGYTASGSVCVVDSAGLGESCVNPSRSCYISNSYCNGTVCICTSGYVQSGTTCVVPQAGYQDNCVSPTRTCSGNLICASSGTCQCSSGYTYSFVSASCVTNTAFYGDSCVNPSRTCGTSNSYCANTGTCLCNTGYTYSSQSASCVSNTALYGQACVNPSRTCVTINSYCGNTGTCLCNIGYTYSSQTTSCVTDIAVYGQSCVNPSRTCTTSNSNCANTGTCQCNNGYTYSSTTSTCIIASAVYGESCVNPLRVCITSNAYCANTGTCQCNGGHTYYFASGSCVSETALYGEPCVNPSRTCVTGNSVCSSSGTCQCNTGYAYSSSLASCITNTANYGESCVNPNRACVTSNSFCGNTGTCQCNSGYTYSSASATCLTNTAFYGESCVNPSRTCGTSNSVCGNTGTCQCNTGYTYSSTLSSCITNTAFYGESCVNPSRTCGTSNSVCGNTGTCQCNTGYTYSFTLSSCITNTAFYGESCVNPSRTCGTSNSVCGNTGTCQCNTGYTYSSTLSSCITNTAFYGELCVNPSRTCGTSNSVCGNTGTCQCNTGYTYSSTLSSCITNTAFYGESCVNPSRTCGTSNSVCGNTGTCQCNTGYTYSSTLSSCITNTADYGDSCVDPDRNCTGNLACENGTCQCENDFIYSASSALCIENLANPGESCVNPSRNCVSTAFCDGSVCRCNSEYYLSSPQTCTLRRGLGESCTTTVTNSCADPNASCVGIISPVCQCNTGYTNSGGTCIVGNADQDCPPGTNVPSSVAGVSSPVSAITPTVTVGQTCYAVNLFDTQIMQCSDTKQASSLQSARWFKLPNTQIVPTTGQFINGDIATPSLTVSSAQSSYAGSYVCQLCYGSSYTRCTNSSTITLFVRGTANTTTSTTTTTKVVPAISSVSVTASSTSPLKGQDVTLTCNVIPSGAAASYRWFLGNTVLGSQSQTYTLTSIQASQSGNYRCEASNVYGSTSSTVVAMDVRYLPEPFGGNTLTTVTDFSSGDVQITCNMVANPAISTYYFYDQQNNLLSTTSSKTYRVSSAQGYQTYRCKAQNSIGMSGFQNLEVVEAGGVPSTGAATEDTGLSTGAIAAIVLGIIFFLLLLLIIIICCCNYGWCRKKEKVEPQVIVEKPVVTQYIPRNIVSATSTISRKDVGIMVNGHHDVSVSTEEEPRYTTPRYHLKPAINGGPIISMYDNGYNQPRAHQLPDLDTQYLYTDDKPRKLHKKKKRRHRSRRHEEDSTRRQYYQPESDPEPKYAEALPASDEDLVVIPGKQNYFE